MILSMCAHWEQAQSDFFRGDADPGQNRLHSIANSSARTKRISCGGMTLITNSAEELAKLEVVLVSTELARDLKVARPKRHNPEVIIFGVNPNLHESRIKCI